MRRRYNPFEADGDSENKLRRRSRRDVVLSSFEETYVRQLLSRHRFTDEFLELVYTHLDQTRKQRIVRDLLPLVAHKAGFSAEMVETGERFIQGLEIDENPQELLTTLLRVCDTKGYRNQAVKALETHCRLANTPKPSTEFEKRLSFLKDTFKLSAVELSLLIFFFVEGSFDKFESLFNAWNKREVHRGIAICLGRTESELYEALRPRGTLRMQRLIDNSRPDRLDFELTYPIVEFLTLPGARNFYENLAKTRSGSVYPFDSFPVSEKQRTLCLTLLKGKTPAQLLLHGSEGSGKTEFARALAAEAGKTAYFYEREDGRQSEALGNLGLVDASLDPATSVIVVDEAEDILDGGSTWLSDIMVGNKDNKARVNTFLDQVRCPIIWIVNGTRSILPSTRRRFTFSIEFSPLKSERLTSLASDAVSELPIGEDAKKRIAELAGNWNLTGAAIANMRSALEELCRSSTDEDEVIRYIETLFAANGKLVSGKPKKMQRVERNYLIDVLNVSIPAVRIQNCVRETARRTEAYETEGRNGLRLLFHGLPGTGKTELARHIAKECDLKLDIRRASDILSPYVGEAERHIAEMFAAAEEAGDILLIDEADSFLYDRGMARQSWELTHVDEFLTRMEEYRGILICTTNIVKNLDTAVLRRFHLKAEFGVLSDENAELLFHRFFPKADLSEEERRRFIAAGPYVPGDFAAVNGVASILPEAELSVEYFLSALKGEAKPRNTRTTTIGFNTGNCGPSQR